ncbi:MAG: amidohydrolase [Deltaproteobacteria bacterium]|nr:amidohydrolase [Deltaproteobacteria bacterium]
MMKQRALPYPDLILFNGKIRTLTYDGALVEALACAGGRIVAAGQSDVIRRLAGPDSRQIDLQNKIAIPGLTDTHVHLSEKGTAEKEYLDCRDFYADVHSIPEILERLTKRASEIPKGSWIVAHGSPMQDFRLKEKRFPDRHDLDRAVPDHPVSIAFGAHITIANSKALALAGIGRDSSFALNQCLERGVTTIHDIVRSGEPIRAYQELLREGRLDARVSLLPRVIESHIGSNSLIELGLHSGFGNEWLRIGGVKMSIDGGITGRNACFYEPYEDDPHNCGIIRIPQDELNETVLQCHQAGLRCCVHAIGDCNWLSTPERMQRLVRSGIIAIPNISIGYYVGDAILDCVGEKRLAKAFPFRTLLKNGVTIAGGSDAPGYWPVDPLRDISACVSRKMRWGEVLVPEERISAAEAFAMHTTTAAFVGFEENDKGTLDVGKLADIAILAEDPFEIPGERIKDIRVEMTIVGGEVKYQA